MKKQYDHYKVLHTIASSTLVSFHLAKDTNTDEDVFLRVLAHSKESAQTNWFTTYDDYQLTIMNYKHLPRVTAINQSHDDDVYTVFPYKAGQSLAARGTLSVTQFEQLIEAVSHLHQKGFIHGRISPENIWITDDGKVLLFGAGEWIVTNVKADKQSDIQDMIEFGSTYCGLDFRGSDEIKTVKDLIPFLTQTTKPGLVEKKVIQKPIKKKEKITVPAEVEDKKKGAPILGKKKPIIVLFSALLLILLTSILIDKSSTSESTPVDSEEIVSSATEETNTDSEPVIEPEPQLTFEEIKVAFKEDLYSKNNKDDSFTIHELDMTDQNRPEIVGISGSDLVNIEIYQFDEEEKAFTLAFSKEKIPVTRTIIEEFAEGKEQIIFANNTTDSQSTQLLAIGAVNNQIEVVLDQELSSSFGVTFDKEKKNLLVEVKDEEGTKYLWDGIEYTQVSNDEAGEESAEVAEAPKKVQTSDTQSSTVVKDKNTTSSSTSSVENGYGEEFYDDGGYYKGNYRNGLFHGKGIFVWPDGTKYEGEFVDGYFQGYGVMTYYDGTRYDGQFKNDMQTGKGKMTWTDGSKYEGEFVDGLQSGYGTQIYNDGSKYVGNFLDGLEHGKGKYTWTDGSWYEGEFKNGWQNGKGTMVWEDGTKFVGVFKDGAPTDEGTWTYP